MRLSDAVDVRNVERIAESLAKYGYRGPRNPVHVVRWLRAQGADIDTPVRGAKRAERERRPDQAAFRRAVLGAYEGRCAITGCDEPAVLEGAHVADWRTDNDVGAGVCLRVDLHRLLERGLLVIDASYRVVEAPPWYAALKGCRLRLPANRLNWPRLPGAARAGNRAHRGLG